MPAVNDLVVPQTSLEVLVSALIKVVSLDSLMVGLADLVKEEMDKQVRAIVVQINADLAKLDLNDEVNATIAREILSRCRSNKRVPIHKDPCQVVRFNSTVLNSTDHNNMDHNNMAQCSTDHNNLSDHSIKGHNIPVRISMVRSSMGQINLAGHNCTDLSQVC